MGTLKLKQAPRKIYWMWRCGLHYLGDKKTFGEVKVGDTITSVENPKPILLLEGFEEVKPMVFAGIYPVESEDFGRIKNFIGKLRLNDISCFWAREFCSIGIWVPLWFFRNATYGNRTRVALGQGV